MMSRLSRFAATLRQGARSWVLWHALMDLVHAARFERPRLARLARAQAKTTWLFALDALGFYKFILPMLMFTLLILATGLADFVWSAARPKSAAISAPLDARSCARAQELLLSGALSAPLELSEPARRRTSLGLSPPCRRESQGWSLNLPVPSQSAAAWLGAHGSSTQALLNQAGASGAQFSPAQASPFWRALGENLGLLEKTPLSRASAPWAAASFYEGLFGMRLSVWILSSAPIVIFVICIPWIWGGAQPAWPTFAQVKQATAQSLRFVASRGIQALRRPWESFTRLAGAAWSAARWAPRPAFFALLFFALGWAGAAGIPWALQLDESASFGLWARASASDCADEALRNPPQGALAACRREGGSWIAVTRRPRAELTDALAIAASAFPRIPAASWDQPLPPQSIRAALLGAGEEAGFFPLSAASRAAMGASAPRHGAVGVFLFTGLGASLCLWLAFGALLLAFAARAPLAAWRAGAAFLARLASSQSFNARAQLRELQEEIPPPCVSQKKKARL